MGSQATAFLLRHSGIRPFRSHGSLLSHDGLLALVRFLNAVHDDDDDDDDKERRRQRTTTTKNDDDKERRRQRTTTTKNDDDEERRRRRRQSTKKTTIALSTMTTSWK